MKKISYLVIIAILLMSVSCKNGQKSSDKTPTQSENTSETTVSESEVSGSSNEITFGQIKVKEKILLFPEKNDTVPYATLSIDFVYPETWSKSDAELQKLRQVFVSHVLEDSLLKDVSSPQKAVDSYVDFYSEDYRKNIKEVYGDEIQYSDDGMAYIYFFECTKTDSIAFVSDNVLSFVYTDYSYMGGAHGMYAEILTSIDLETIKPIALADVFLPEAMDKLDALIRKKLLENVQEEGLDESYFFDYENIKANENFCITDKGINFVYNQYEIAAYAAGVFRIELSYDEIEALLKTEVKQKYFSRP